MPAPRRETLHETTTRCGIHKPDLATRLRTTCRPAGPRNFVPKINAPQEPFWSIMLRPARKNHIVRTSQSRAREPDTWNLGSATGLFARCSVGVCRLRLTSWVSSSRRCCPI